MKKIVSIIMAVAIIMSLTVTAFAEGKSQKVEVAGSNGGYMVVSGYDSVGQANDKPVFSSASPVTITYNGNYLCSECVMLLASATQDSLGAITDGDIFIDVPLDIEEYDSDYNYALTGNKVTLKSAGIYIVFALGDEVIGGFCYVVISGSSTSTILATPTASKVLVNGISKSFDAYSINDNNYFKLRDLAYVLNGSAKQFEVSWDEAKNAISLTSNKAYTNAGGEMATGNKANASAKPTTSAVYIDGKQVTLTAYNINGNNYFKLRDVGQAFNVGIGWDDTTSTISIDTSASYSK